MALSLSIGEGLQPDFVQILPSVCVGFAQSGAGESKRNGRRSWIKRVKRGGCEKRLEKDVGGKKNERIGGFATENERMGDRETRARGNDNFATKRLGENGRDFRLSWRSLEGGRC